MMRKPLILFFAGLLSLTWAHAATACRYTVRDVAFVDLGERPYQLFLFTKQAERIPLTASFEQAATEVFADANVVAEHLDLAQAPEHPSGKYAEELTEFPAVVLVAPDDRVLKLDWEISSNSTHEDLLPLLETIVDSPTRRELVSKVCDVHSVILVIDGMDEQTNRKTLQMAEEAIPQVEEALEFMAKPIKNPPHLIHLSPPEAAREKVLLWSLGVDLRPSSPSQIALLFGRSRKLGPVLRFPEDPRHKFVGSLAVVGQDCECGLDRRWMQGLMVPHLWSTRDEAVATRKLNFDPGNPLVQAEIDRIITRGPGSEPGSRRDIDQANSIFPALSYQEIELDEVLPTPPTKNQEAAPAAAVEATPGQQEESAEQTDSKAGKTSVARADARTGLPLIATNTESPARSSSGHWALMLLAGSAALVVGIGLLVLLRKRES